MKYLVWSLGIGFALIAIISMRNESRHDCQERYYREAYIKANTLLKYYDSINKSGLIINLSKYQPEYVEDRMRALNEPAKISGS